MHVFHNLVNFSKSLGINFSHQFHFIFDFLNIPSPTLINMIHLRYINLTLGHLPSRIISWDTAIIKCPVRDCLCPIPIFRYRRRLRKGTVIRSRETIAASSRPAGHFFKTGVWFDHEKRRAFQFTTLPCPGWNFRKQQKMKEKSTGRPNQKKDQTISTSTTMRNDYRRVIFSCLTSQTEGD